MTRAGRYVLHYWFEWGGGCLWPANDAARDEFGLGPLDLGFELVGDPPRSIAPALALPAELLERCQTMAAWHDTALNWEYPPDPGPWRQPECDRFNAAARALLADIRRVLGPEYSVVDRQRELAEDPDLDAYLADPEGFRR